MLQEYDINAHTDFGYDPYAQTFDAFQKKQLWLDLDVEPAFESMDNVYDESERSNRNAYYKWDFAYLDGRYYCYFGVAPVLTFYYPFYRISGKLPTVPIATAFFTIPAALFICLTILAAVRIIVPKPNLILLLLSMPAAVSCVGVCFIMNYADMYCLPLASGMCFLAICLWSGMTGFRVRIKVLRCIMFFISGTSLVLCTASRPGMALGAAVLMPFYLSILTDRRQKPVFRIIQSVFFAVPVSVGAAAIMWYNYERFGSVFDFGAACQLTVSDIHANKIRLSDIPASIYHYFLQIPRPCNTFPFFEPEFASFNNYGCYKYYADVVGVLSYPFVLAGMIMLPSALSRKINIKSRGRIFIVLCIAISIFTAWQDFCLGGINQRYVTDIMPLMAVCSAVILLCSKIHMHCIYIAASMVLTVCIVYLMALGPRDCALSIRCPELYDILEDILIFWR